MKYIKNKGNIMKLISLEYSKTRNELFINDFDGKCIYNINFYENEKDKNYYMTDEEPNFDRVFNVSDDIIYDHFMHHYKIDIFTCRIQNSLQDISTVDSLYQIAFECTNFARIEYCFALDEEEVKERFYKDIYEDEIQVLSINKIA